VEPYSYSWSPAEPLSDPNRATTRGSLAETTDFTLTVTDAAGRTATNVVKTVVVPALEVDGDDDIHIRPGQSVWLKVKITGGLPPHSLQWSPAFLITESAARSVLVKPSVDTVFDVLATDALGQEATARISVSLAQPLGVTAEAKPASVLLGESTRLIGSVSGGVPPYEYIWGPAEEIASPANVETGLTPTVTRTYGLNVRDSLGQTGAASIRVVVVRPEQAVDTESALQSPQAAQAPQAPGTPTLLPTCGAGLLGVLPLMAASMIPFRRRRSRRA
jgi:hypothetical protein